MDVDFVGLRRIGELAEKHSMKLIFNTHLKEIVPRNIDGAVYKPATPDTANVSGIMPSES